MGKKDAAAFIAAALVLWAGLGSYGLIEPSDARYAEISFEMWQTGDYIYPKLMGIHHFHKPPLIFWLSSLGYAIFGPNEWGARACLAVLGMLLSFITWNFARRFLDGEGAPWSVVFLVTTPAVIAASRMLTTDLLLITCQTALLSSWYALWSGRGRGADRLVLYLSAGLAFLAKGPVAWAVPVLIILPFSLLRRGRETREKPAWGLRWGIPLALAVALPWYLIVVSQTPGLFQYFTGDQIMGRVSAGGAGHVKPWHFFLPLFPALGIPWIFFAPAGWRRLRTSAPPTAVFLLLWVAVPPLFFSLPATKLPLYILLSYPAFALLAGEASARGADGLKLPLKLSGAIMAALGVGLLVAGAVLPSTREGDLFSPAALLPLSAVFLLSGSAAVANSRRRPRRALLVLTAGLLLVPVWFLFGKEGIHLRSARIVGTAARAVLQEDDILAEYRTLASGLPFYSGRQPLIAWVPRETLFEREEVKKRVIDAAAFLDIWHGRQRVLVVTRARHLGDLPGARKIAEGGSYVLASNR